MKKIVLTATALFLCLLSFSQNVNDLIKKGIKLIDEKKYDSALAIFNKVWSIDSSVYEIYTNRGTIFYNQKKWNESFDEYTKAIEKWPDSADAYHYRAILLFTLTYTDDAIADNTKALQLSTNDSLTLSCFTNRGNCYQQKREFQQAYEDYSRAYLLDSTNIGVINNIATVLDELGRSDEAIINLKKLTRIDPGFIGAYVNLGFQYTRLGKYREAIEYFDKALLIEKDEPLALNNRGLAKYNLNDYAGALADINKSISIFPGNSYAYKNRALVYLALKQKDKACADIQMALDQKFTEVYGDEVLKLKNENCVVK